MSALQDVCEPGDTLVIEPARGTPMPMPLALSSMLERDAWIDRVTAELLATSGWMDAAMAHGFATDLWLGWGHLSPMSAILDFLDPEVDYPSQF